MSGKIIQFRRPSKIDGVIADLRAFADELGEDTKVQGLALVLLVDHNDIDVATTWFSDRGHHVRLIGAVEQMKHRMLEKIDD